MLIRVLAVASLILVAALIVLWPERIRWTENGSGIVAHEALPIEGEFPIVIGPESVIAIEGDSLIAGQRGRETQGEPWPERLAGLLGGPEVVNRGRGAQTAVNGEESWRDAPCVDLAIILYGANDAGIRGWIRGRSAIPIDEYRTAMQATIARHRACGAQIVVLAPLAPGSSAMAERLAPFRAAAHQIATEEGVPFLDPITAWNDVAAPLQIDGLHVSDAGREALAQFIAEKITVERPATP